MNLKRNKHISRKKGAIYLFMVLILSVTTVAIAIGFTTPNVREFKNALRDNLSNSAFVMAEAGNEDVYYRLLNAMNVPAEIVYTLGDITATTTVVTIGNQTYIETESSIDNHVRKAKLDVSDLATNIEFLYSAQVGEGGVNMGNNASITGDFYSDGPVTGSTGATITGDAYISGSLIESGAASSTVCDLDHIVGQADPKIDYAQSFEAPTSTALHSVDIFIKKVGNPKSVKIKLVADNAGEPDTTIIAEGTLDKTKVTNIYSWVSIDLEPQASLVEGTTYWLILDAKRDNSKYWIWCSDSAAGYTDGEAKYSKKWTSDPWFLLAEDLTFKSFFGEGGESFISDVTVNGDVHADTIENSTITGDAYYKNISGTVVGGTSYPDSDTPAEQPDPISDTVIAQWKADALAGGIINGDCGDTGAEAACEVLDDDTLSLGPVQVNGNLIIAGNNQTINVTGTIYITGTIDFGGNNLTVKCDASFADESCIMMSDGWNHLQNNINFDGSGDPDSYIILMTLLAGCNGSGGAGCTHHDSAVDYHNNGSGAIVYAPFSQVYLHNGVILTGVVANRLELSENAQVIYEDEINNPIFSSGGGGGGWLVNDWREIE